jgi:hypothetical protein
MKAKLLSLMPLMFAAAAAGSNNQELQIKTVLNSQDSYKLYEFLDVAEVAEQGGKVLVKRSGDVVCTRTSFYPGDREYECSVEVYLNRAGETAVKN